MDFDYSAKTAELQKRLAAFMDEYVYPNEPRYHDEVNSGDRWQPIALIEELKREARKQGLWNLFLPDVSGLSNLEYAPLAEMIGRVTWASRSSIVPLRYGQYGILHLYGTESRKQVA